MPVVQAPDGSVVEFPDSMSESQINAAMAAQFGQGKGPAPAALPAPARIPLGGASSLLSGIESAIGLPGTIESLAQRLLPLPSTAPAAPPNSLSQAFGSWLDAGGPMGRLPSGSELGAATNALGLTSNPALAPQSTPERYSQAIASGLGSAIPFAGIGAPLVTLATGAAAGAASEKARDLFPNNPFVPPLVGAAVGLGGQGVASALSGQNVEKIAASLGTSSTLEEAGKAAQGAARSWLGTTMPAKLASAWAPVDAAIPAQAETPLTQTLDALHTMTKKAGGLQPVVDAISSKLPKQLLSLLQNKTPLGVGVNPSWEEVQQLRSAVGDAMANPQVVKDIPQQQLANLYRAITGDMHSVAASHGAGDLFSAANAESSRLYSVAEGPVAKLVSGAKPSPADDPLPENAAAKLLSGARKGGTDLATLRTEVPDAVDELAAAHLRGAGPDWTKLSPEAKASLVPNVRQREALDLAMPQKLPNGLNPISHSIEGVFGLGLGGAATSVIGRALGIHENPVLMGQMGELIGGTAPTIYRAAKAVAKNPRLLKLPLTGALAGSNPLAGQ